jgi:archaellum component FlaG (FlaF/FlaG flagellin family)
MQKEGTATAEDIQANFAQIHDPGDFIIPSSIAEEMGLLAKAFAD